MFTNLKFHCFFSSYAELIADWPVVVLGVCTVLIVVCALVGILVPDLPDFSDPLLVSTAPDALLFGLMSLKVLGSVWSVG